VLPYCSAAECTYTVTQLLSLKRGIEIEVEQTMINLGYASEAKEERRSEAMHNRFSQRFLEKIEGNCHAVECFLKENMIAV